MASEISTLLHAKAFPSADIVYCTKFDWSRAWHQSNNSFRMIKKMSACDPVGLQLCPKCTLSIFLTPKYNAISHFISRRSRECEVHVAFSRDYHLALMQPFTILPDWTLSPPFPPFSSSFVLLGNICSYLSWRWCLWCCCLSMRPDRTIHNF